MTDETVKAIVRNAIDNADSRVLNNLLTILASVSRNRLRDEQFAKQLLSMRIVESKDSDFGVQHGVKRHAKVSRMLRIVRAQE